MAGRPFVAGSDWQSDAGSIELDASRIVLVALACRLVQKVICFYTGKEDGPAYEN
jgi:hypothetical protein